MKSLAALKAAGEREGFFARLELLGVAALCDADGGAVVSRGGDRSGDCPVRPLRGPIAAAARAGIHERRARDHLGRARDRDGARPTARLRSAARRLGAGLAAGQNDCEECESRDCRVSHDGDLVRG